MQSYSSIVRACLQETMSTAPSCLPERLFVNTENNCAALFMDLSKVFHTVDHHEAARYSERMRCVTFDAFSSGVLHVASASDQSASFEELLAAPGGRCAHLKTTVVAFKEVSVDAAAASVPSEPEGSLKEEQRTALKDFMQ